MAIIKKRQMKELSNNDLKARLQELRLELAKEKAQIAVGGTASNTGRVGELKRTVAKLLTEINKREVVNG